MSTQVRNLLVGTDYSVAERMRRRRWALVETLFPDIGRLRVLDLGGTPAFWQAAPVSCRPAEVTTVNLGASPEVPGIRSIVGDACRADELLTGEHFDLVFSNSLIEHLGGHHQRKQFAMVATEMGDDYWVQTPYRYFPVEPHWLFPGFQFLPVRVRGELAPRWPLGCTYGWDRAAAREEVQFTELISASELYSYFPGGVLHWERIMAVPKSMVISSR